MEASYHRYILQFKRPGGTSRGVLREKETWFIVLRNGDCLGIGECGLFRGLSPEDTPGYENKLQQLCGRLREGEKVAPEVLAAFPSIRFGLEQAYASLEAKTPYLLFPSDFTEGKDSIPINGLIWMGSKAYMKAQIHQRLEEGYRCLKMKIGALDFAAELELLGGIRKEFSAKDVEIRVDANGAFGFSEAPEKLERLAAYDLHSIEQPIRPGNWEQMAELCNNSPLSIALDEELIGISSVTGKRELLQTIKPAFLILKPSLLGGFGGCGEWMEMARETETAWWVTSALESNIGLNAIAQWTYRQGPILQQGLGTGSLFANNLESPLSVAGGYLSYDPSKKWNQQIINKLCT